MFKSPSILLASFISGQLLKRRLVTLADSVTTGKRRGRLDAHATTYRQVRSGVAAAAAAAAETDTGHDTVIALLFQN